MERIADGFALAEAPTVTPDGDLLVADVLAGGIRRFAPDGTERAPALGRRRGIGGMAVRPDGSVVVTGRDLSVLGPDGELTTIATPPPASTGCNDIAVAGDGTLVAGILTCHPMAGGPLTPALLAVVDPSGVQRLAELELTWPNGIGFSPDGCTLYVADFDRGIVHASPWTSDAPMALDLQPWAQSPTGDADGLAVAADGSLWVAGGAGGVLLHLDPDGAQIGELPVPDAFVSSCTFWSGPDRLAITTGTSVFVHDLG